MPSEPAAMVGRLRSSTFMRTNFDYNGPDGKGTTFALTYEYPLSKRTTLFGSYAQVNNNDQGRVSIQAATVAVFPAFAGADIKAYSVGMRHAFRRVVVSAFLG